MRGGNKNGWVGGVSWFMMNVILMNSQVKSFEIGRIPNLGRRNNYMTVNSHKNEHNKDNNDKGNNRAKSTTTTTTTTTK